MKKVYFVCAVAGGRDHAFVYQDIVDVIKAQSVEVLGEALANPNLESEGMLNPKYTPRYVWRRDTNRVNEVDGVIAEVTQPSLGVGYILATAESLKVPILALFYQKSGRPLSPMVQGNPNISCFKYTSYQETEVVIKKFIVQLSQPNSA